MPPGRVGVHVYQTECAVLTPRCWVSRFSFVAKSACTSRVADVTPPSGSGSRKSLLNGASGVLSKETETLNAPKCAAVRPSTLMSHVWPWRT